MRSYVPWTKAEEDRLLNLLDGNPVPSSKEIARVLSVSKNAIIGKVRRMKRECLRAKPSPDNTVTLKRLNRFGANRYTPAPSVAGIVREAPKSKRVPDMQLKLSKAVKDPPPAPARDAAGAVYTVTTVPSQVCRFPYGDPGHKEFHYCGQPGYPWCEYHKKICYTPSQPRR